MTRDLFAMALLAAGYLIARAFYFLINRSF